MTTVVIVDAAEEQLRDVIGEKKPGDHVTLSIYRSNEHQTLKVELGRQPSTAS